jgi:uncharacterized protein (TIGR00297 family)
MPALAAFLFALLAYRVRGVSTTGAIAGAVLAFVILLSCGLPGFLVVALVFVLATISTRMGYTRKRELGVAERRCGRNASQVLANILVATICALFSAGAYGWREPLQLAMIAALAEAAADTVASEVGQAFSGRVYLITSFQRVAIGTDGGISVIGTAGAAAAAVLVALTGAWTELIPGHWIALAAGAALLSTMLDSLLGATLQRRGWLGNNGVNLLSTAAAAGLALLMAHNISR